MKILIIGLDCAAPEIVFAHPELSTLRRLMQSGCYGRLESVVPPITVPAWMCMSTSQDPGSLGVYGFRNRAGHGYDDLAVVDSRAITAPALWDRLEALGRRSIVAGVPPGYPPRTVNGVSIGCFLTPEPDRNAFTYPATVKQELERLVGTYPVDVKGFRTTDKDWLRDEIYTMTRKHFECIRYLMMTMPWDCLQLVEIGLDRIQHGFWKHHDPSHRQHDPNSRYRSVVSDYYAYLDQEIAETLDLLDEDAVVLVVSDHGAQRLDGGFCVNEWLIREGLLTLKQRPEGPTPFSTELVDWERTRAWSEGGYYARVFVNVEGREPSGVVPQAAYDDTVEDLRRRLLAIPDDRGRPMPNRVFRPREIYREVRNVAPDLIVHFGDLFWRSVGGVGGPDLYVQENDTGPDDCNHAQFGMFILAAPGLPAVGEVLGVTLLDMAPTVLELAGIEAPPSMQGRSIVERLRAGDRA